ncbi:MAG: alpha/beta hydrolase family protein [Janthinobacterium lividum]
MTPAGAATALIRAMRGVSVIRVIRAIRAIPVIALTTLALLPLAPASATPGAAASAPIGMNETVVMIPGDDPGAAALETTLFTPDGNGPFPVVIFNHGKERGNPHQQARSRPLAFAREFVRRGYMVVAPNRRGFAHSSGTYTEQRCGIDANGLEQAADIAATVRYVQHLPDADATRIVIAGASQGGLATLAYGVQPGAGVRGLINFVGGLRQDSCEPWQQAMSDAFQDYGQRSRLPTLWFYGDNDLLWPQALAQHLLTVYRAGGGLATMMDFGNYKDNAHRLVGDRDAVPIWWPAVEDFLVALHLPVEPRDPAPQVFRPPATGYAPVDAVAAVPYLDDSGRAGYATFLQQYSSRAFALSASGAWSWAEGGDDPAAVALDNCQRNSREPCRLYAVDSDVVWNAR